MIKIVPFIAQQSDPGAYNIKHPHIFKQLSMELRYEVHIVVLLSIVMPSSSRPTCLSRAAVPDDNMIHTTMLQNVSNYLTVNTV
jgi:hypothetical protein